MIWVWACEIYRKWTDIAYENSAFSPIGIKNKNWIFLYYVGMMFANSIFLYGRQLSRTKPFGLNIPICNGNYPWVRSQRRPSNRSRFFLAMWMANHIVRLLRTFRNTPQLIDKESRVKHRNWIFPCDVREWHLQMLFSDHYFPWAETTTGCTDGDHEKYPNKHTLHSAKCKGVLIFFLPIEIHSIHKKKWIFSCYVGE